MSVKFSVGGGIPRLSLGLLVVALMLLQAVPARAGGFFRNRAVGGVAIDTDGVLRPPTAASTDGLAEAVRQRLSEPPAEMDQAVGMRKISLRQLEAALQAASEQGTPIPDEIRYLAGIQRIQYVFVYPEQQDLVLAGPGEGWAVDALGNVVGKTTGQPVVQLDDLLMAFRSVQAARQGGISCSIDPTPEGIQAMRSFVRRQRQFSPGVVEAIAEKLGPQQITVTGVPATSHFARVLVAADYRMKRIAMQLDPSPLPELPSFLSMLSESRVKLTNMMPRWWLASDYEPLARSEDGLAWELRGQGVKVMTEDDLVTDQGEVTNTGTANPVAQRWANDMTRHYEELAKREAVFGQLRNLMDLCVVAAVVEKEGLVDRAGCQLPLITGEVQDLTLESYNPPKTVATECSVMKRGREYIITASGGVQIGSWQAASKTQIDPAVAQRRQQAVPAPTAAWWWN